MPVPHGDLAQLAAVVGAVGAAILLLARTRVELLSGVAVAAAGEAMLAVALIPGHDLKRFVTPATHLGALVFGLLLLGAIAWAFVRWPVVVPVALLAAAPFRISTSVGTQTAYLLDPLYVVLAAAVLALVVRTIRGQGDRVLPRLIAIPAAVFVFYAGLSLLWTHDLRALLSFLLGGCPPASALPTPPALSPAAAPLWSVRGAPCRGRGLGGGGGPCAGGGGAFAAATAVSDSARQATSGRTRLARVTW